MIVIGIQHQSFHQQRLLSPNFLPAWSPPPSNTIPLDEKGDDIRRGELLFNDTTSYAPAFVGDRLNCNSCHLAGGIVPYASPVVGLPKLFPMFNMRAGHVISLQDRIQECFTRSENGKPLGYDSDEMRGLVSYISWLSQPQPDRRPFIGRGLIELPHLQPDVNRGAKVYSTQCAGCHGAQGEGIAPLYPPLWGPQSFNDGAGMSGIDKMAAFVQHNMPENRPGILSPQDAYDVAGFLHMQRRPAFNSAYSHF